LVVFRVLIKLFFSIDMTHSLLVNCVRFPPTPVSLAGCIPKFVLSPCLISPLKRKTLVPRYCTHGQCGR
jgi:hypothetical protein